MRNARHAAIPAAGALIGAEAEWLIVKFFREPARGLRRTAKGGPQAAFA
jgi:hypothetical protein